MAAVGNGYTVGWQTIISAASLFFVIFGAGWTLMQTQFNNAAETANIIRVDLQRREAELKDQIKEIRTDIVRRSELFVRKSELAEFKDRINHQIDTNEKQFAVIRQASPSVGEIQTALKALESRITLLHEEQDRLVTKAELDALVKAHTELTAEAYRSFRREIDTIHRNMEQLRERINSFHGIGK